MEPTGASSAVASLLASLGPDTDLARLVSRVHREKLRCVVISATSLAAWQSRDAAGWAQVSEWLALQGVAVLKVVDPPQATA